MNILVNPGSGPVEGATEEHAIENMKHYLVDCDVKGLTFVRFPENDERGRFCFLVFKNNGYKTIAHYVDMPGLPLHLVRYNGSEGQNIFNFPRLYVDGSSWVWEFAILNDEDFEFPEEE